MELMSLLSAFLYVVLISPLIYIVVIHFAKDAKDKMGGKTIYLLIVGFLLILFSIISPIILVKITPEPKAAMDGEKEEKSVYDTTGPLGDTLGGVMNPFVGMAGVIITGLAFYAQYKANQAFLEANKDLKKQFDVQQFESQLYKLLDYHRSNVSEMEFLVRNKYFKGQKVFKSITMDIGVLYDELKRFFELFTEDEILTIEFRQQLATISQKRNDIKILEFARINLAYYIAFLGLSANDAITLIRALKKYYQIHFLTEVVFYFRLKTSDGLENWALVKRTTPIKNFRKKYTPWCKEIKENEHGSQDDQDLNHILMNVNSSTKYYGGHQFRLSHYFRNLYYIFKLIDESSFLEEYQKKQYAKVVRSQLSTFELYLLFYNSISKMGWDWEFKHIGVADKQLISKYGIIKNIPGLKIRNVINIHSYFPDIEYEFAETTEVTNLIS